MVHYINPGFKGNTHYGNIKILHGTPPAPPSESFFPCSLDNFPIGFLLVDPGFNIISFNAPAAGIIKDIWGIKANEGENLLNAFQSADKRAYTRYFKKALIGEITREVTMFEKADRSCTIDISIHPIREKNGISSICLSFEDITDRKKAELHLTKSKRLYQNLIESIPGVYWITDIKKNKIIYVSPSYESIVGRSSEDLYNKKTEFLQCIHPEDRAGLISSYKGREGKMNSSYRIIKPGGEIRWVIAKSSISIEEGLAIEYGYAQDVTDQKINEKKLRDSQERNERQIIEITLAAQEKERNFLGKELHDNINQILATVKMYLGLVGKESFNDAELIAKSQEYTVMAMEEIKKLAYSLVDPYMENKNLLDVIEDLTIRMNINKSMQFRFLNDLQPGVILHQKVELMIYRIIQEQVNNILKYAKATETVIHLLGKEGRIYLIISDNGCGFDTNIKARGIGLLNIKNRVEHYSGKMNIVSAPGNGCVLEISFPQNLSLPVDAEIIDQLN